MAVRVADIESRLCDVADMQLAALALHEVLALVRHERDAVSVKV